MQIALRSVNRTFELSLFPVSWPFCCAASGLSAEALVKTGIVCAGAAPARALEHQVPPSITSAGRGAKRYAGVPIRVSRNPFYYLVQHMQPEAYFLSFLERDHLDP